MRRKMDQTPSSACNGCTAPANLHRQEEDTALRKRFVFVVKIILPLAILAWLVTGLVMQPPPGEGEPTTLERLADQPKQWELVVAGFACYFAAFSITILRWYVLVVTLGLRFRLRNAFRLGFLGYLLSFVSAGAVGGDLFKAVFIAREQPGRRTEAVATIVLDRVIGIFALMLLACGAVALLDFQNAGPEVIWLARAAIALTVVGLVGGGLVVFWPGLTDIKLVRRCQAIPKIGPILGGSWTPCTAIDSAGECCWWRV